jgi:hypothetical protein
MDVGKSLNPAIDVGQVGLPLMSGSLPICAFVYLCVRICVYVYVYVFVCV